MRCESSDARAPKVFVEHHQNPLTWILKVFDMPYFYDHKSLTYRTLGSDRRELASICENNATARCRKAFAGGPA